MKRITTLILALALFSSTALAQAFEFWPGAEYDPAIPTLEATVGHAPGERITTHADMLRYLEALEQAAPERFRLVTFGQSWQGRDLVYAIVTSPENLSRVEAIKAGMQALRNADRTDAAEARRIIESQPAVTWLSYSVHGNEISSTDAALLTAYHLLAAQNDPRVGQILEQTVVIIDPLQNPDGRERFILRYEMSRGLEPDSDRLSAEHNEPWPSGRTNHYLFDLNRDWFKLTQPETRARVRVIQEWYPVAFVDAHEMGSDSTYFFAPEAVPYNPNLAEGQRALLEDFGRNNARWFDRFGIDYFTREVFDAFYPGYGASWPSYFGSVAMTYEQASSRGLVVRRRDGTELPYAETVRNHFVTSLATAETVATQRQRMLEAFHEYQLSAIEEGRDEGVRSYLIPTQADQAGADKLARLLVQQGARVGRATEGFFACGQDYEPGSYVIDLAQPAKRLLRTLLDVDTAMDDAFVAEQERRRAKGLPDEIYDVTAWSLPLMMNLTVRSCDRTVGRSLETVAADEAAAGILVGPDPAVSYLVPWGQAPAIRLLAHAHRRGLVVKSSDRAFVNGGVRYPAGTLILDAADNPPDLRATLGELARMTGADVQAVEDSWVTDGPNFGSGQVVRMNAPSIAMAWDRPTNAYSAGNTRYVIERQFDTPVTVIRTDDLKDADLRRYQVLILPSTWGNYRAVLGEPGARNLADWVRRGGVLITLGGGTRFAAHPEVDLLGIRRERAFLPEALEESEIVPEEAGDSTVPGILLDSAEALAASEAPLADSPDSVGGVLLRASVDPDHWLTAGVGADLHVLARGSDIYTPLRRDDGVNVVRFQGEDELLASGYLWEENRRQLAFKPFTVVQEEGDGIVIGFTQDPTVRAYLDGLNVLLMNAIFRGAAHARPVR
jgi:hypothetical protein